MPRDQVTAVVSTLNLGLEKDWPEQLSTCIQHSVKVMKTLQDLLKNALQAVVTSGGNETFRVIILKSVIASVSVKFSNLFPDLDNGLSAEKLKDMAAISSERVYDTEDLGPVPTLKASLTIIQQMAANLAQRMAECENELAMASQVPQQQQGADGGEPVTPILQRAQVAKKESEETKILSR